jgi:hypothetical protein
MNVMQARSDRRLKRPELDSVCFHTNVLLRVGSSPTYRKGDPMQGPSGLIDEGSAMECPF